MRPVSDTLKYYDEYAPEVAATYEAVNFDSFRNRLQAMLAPGARVLDIGSGSGRDSAALIDAGFDVRLVDGSAGLLREAVRLHPQLAGRTHRVVLPAILPFDDATFDGVTAWAMIMHLQRDQIPTAFGDSRVCAPGAGFRTLEAQETGDIVGRSGIRWVTFYARRTG